MDAIRTENLSKIFDGLTAVDRLTLTVESGELFGLVGSDGAGKTTTMRMLAAIMAPSGGDAWVMGMDVGRGGERIKEEIGYMSQRFGLYPDLTVMENIRFYCDIYGVPGRGRGERIDSLLSFSNLTPFVKRRAGNLSGGMKQKLGLVCALVHTPRLLLLDEPTNGVDPVSRREFWRILHRLLKEGVTMFVSTAYLDEADRCDRVGLMHGGRLLACDTPDNLRALMRGVILEVLTGEPRRAVRLLGGRLRDANVGLFGDRVHVVTRGDPDETRVAVERVLRDENLPLLAIRRVEPGMEDLFVSVMAREGAEGGGREASLGRG